MKRYTWRADERGIIYVKAPLELEHAPTLGMQEARTMDAVIGRWEPLAAKHAARTGVPVSWILATIWRESEGNPMAVNPEDRSTPADDGLGLMQLTFKFFNGGHSRTEMMDPELNVRIGTDYLASQSKRYGGDGPKVFASYNHGSVSPSDLNPYGMVSTGNHIDSEVGSNNYYLMRSLLPESVGATRVVTDEEVAAEGAVLLDGLSKDLDTSPEPLADEPTSPATPAAKLSSRPPPAATD